MITQADAKTLSNRIENLNRKYNLEYTYEKFFKMTKFMNAKAEEITSDMIMFEIKEIESISKQNEKDNTW